MRIQITEVARELGKSPKEIIEIGKKIGINVKDTHSNITTEEARKIQQYIILLNPKNKLNTITPNGDKVMVSTIIKTLNIDIEELKTLSKEINISIKYPQQIISLNEANEIVKYIELKKQKLTFNPNQWKSYSNIDEFQNLVKFIDEVLSIIDTQIIQNKEILKDSNNAYKELLVLEMDNDDLMEIKTYLLSKFDFSLENLKDKLIYMKSESLEFLDEVDNSLSIWNDEKLSQKKINFNFTATKIIRLYEDQMRKLDDYSKVNEFFNKLLLSIKNLQNLDEHFKTTSKEKLQEVLKDGYLEEYTDKLYQEWKNEIDKLNKLYLKFIKAYFIGKISENMVLEMFNIINDIKSDLEEFYLTIRSGLITKYKENPKSDFIQEIATKDRIFKIYQSFQPRFIELLKKESSQVSYRFLNQILSELLDFEIEEKSKTFEEIYQKMAELHSKNLEIYLNDIVMYGKELEKRDMEISKLMFKMQKDLEKGE